MVGERMALYTKVEGTDILHSSRTPLGVYARKSLGMHFYIRNFSAVLTRDTQA